MNQRSSRVARASISAAVVAACIGAAAAAIPTEQQAIVQNGNGGPEVLKLQNVTVRKPAANEVLIQVYAAAVNPVDWKMRAGRGGPPPGERPPAAGGAGGPPPPMAMAMTMQRIPGMDVAGVVAEVGPGVTSVKVGEPVFSMLGMSIKGTNGGYAHYALAPADNVVAKPKKISYAQAAGLGTVGMTGARSVSLADIKKGQRVLITGVAGGVGSSAAQIAIARGAHVIGTASARHAAFLKSIGVSEVIDYTQPNWASQAKNIDAVIDTVGGETAPAAFGTLKKGGTFVSVASRDITPEKCAAAGVNCPAPPGPPTPGAARSGPTEGEYLQDVAKLVNEGKFKIHIDKSFPLAQAAEAQEYNRQGHTEGKVVLDVTAQADKD